jgi:hypothetical protein
METREHAVIQLELKYCERCGGLFLRRQSVGEVYCSRCMEQMSPGWSRTRPKRLPRLPVNRSANRLLHLVPNTGREEKGA